jgi:hypothetical protein
MMQTMNLELFTDEKIPLFPPFIKGDEKNSPPFHKGGHGGIL